MATLVSAYTARFPVSRHGGVAGWGGEWGDIGDEGGGEERDAYIVCARCYVACIIHALGHLSADEAGAVKEQEVCALCVCVVQGISAYRERDMEKERANLKC